MQLSAMQISFELFALVDFFSSVLECVPGVDLAFETAGCSAGAREDGALGVEGEVAVADSGGVLVEARDA